MMSNSLALSVFLLALLLSAPAQILAARSAKPINLDERMIEISRVSAMLSSLAYKGDAAEKLAVVSSKGGEARRGGGPERYEHPELDYIHFYTRDPDQAIVARQGGRCYISFRGTVHPTTKGLEVFLDDWEQNVDLGDRDIHRDGDDAQPGCEGRRGYAEFMDTKEAKAGFEDVLQCIDDCTSRKDCLVITGHSQGGAQATVASILLRRWRPTVVTFGQPPAVDPGCDLIPSGQFYRFVNSRARDVALGGGVGFDAVPFSPTIFSGSVHYGHVLLLGDDVDGGSAMKYLGFGNIDFEPNLLDLSVDAHTMSAADGAIHTYEARMNSIAERYLRDRDAGGAKGVETAGFSDGSPCEYEDLCRSGRCSNNVCTSGAVAVCRSGGIAILSNLVGLYSMMG